MYIILSNIKQVAIGNMYSGLYIKDSFTLLGSISHRSTDYRLQCIISVIVTRD